LPNMHADVVSTITKPPKESPQTIIQAYSCRRGRSGVKYSDTSGTENAADATVDAPQDPTPRPATCSLSRPSLFSDLC